MKSNWPIKKLGEICELRRGSEPGSRTYNTKGNGIRFIRVADVSKQRTGPIRTTGENLVICKKDDILMTFDGSPGVVFRGIEGAISSGIRIVKPKDSRELLDVFLFYVLQTEPVQNTVKKYTIGVSIWHASKSISHIEILLPPIKIQKQIVARIEELFEKIDRVKELREKVQEETETIFPSAMQDIFSKAKKKWRVKKLGEICKFYNGKAHEKFIVDNGKYIIVNSKFISSEGKIAKCSNRNLSPLIIGDIAIVMSDVPNGKSLAKCFLVNQNDKFTLNQRIGLIRSGDFDNKFLFYQLNRNKYFLTFNNGETQTNLRKNDILNCPLLILPLSEQKKIVAELDNLREKVEKLKQLQQNQSKELTELKQSILDKSFKGEL